MFNKIASVSTMVYMLMAFPVAPVLAKGTTVVKPPVSHIIVSPAVKPAVIKPTMKSSVKPMAPKQKLKVIRLK